MWLSLCSLTSLFINRIFFFIKGMLDKFLYYLNPLTLFNRNKEDSINASHKSMQLVNRISIYLFIFCLVMIARKYL